MIGDNINLERASGEVLTDYIERISEHIKKLRWQSEGHRQWYTHKNPYGCWICELLQVTELIRDNVLDEIKHSRQLADKKRASRKLKKHKVEGALS